MATPLRLEVLKFLKKIQSRHGISEEQYIRYRQYCTRRLHRVRTASDVKLGVKGGKKYVSQELSADKMETPKHLTIPLLIAERAWAFANEDQINLEQPLDDNNGQSDQYLRRHVTLSFRKAVKHALEFESLCEQTADEYTQLQAHFYVNWMQGVLAIHISDLQSALKSFTTAKSILDGLDSINDVEIKAICAERSQTIGQFITFCNTRLKRAGANMDTLNLSLATHDPTLLAKINNARQQALEHEDAKKSVGEGSEIDNDLVTFGPATFKILNTKVKHHLIEARSLYASYGTEATRDVGSGVDNSIDDEIGKSGKYQLLSALQNSFDNAIIQLHQDLKQAEIAHGRAQTSATEETLRNINGILSYIGALKYEAVFMRHYLQLIDLVQKHDTKNAIAIKTIHAVIDRLGHVISQGAELLKNQQHFFTTSLHFGTTLQEATVAFTSIQRYYSIQYYLSVVTAQFKAFESNTPVVLPKDFVIDPFTSIPSLPQRTKVLLAMVKANTTQLGEVLAKASNGDSTQAKMGQFSFLRGLFGTQEWSTMFQTKIAQLTKTASQLKVIYYSASQSPQQTNEGAVGGQDAGVPVLLDRLGDFQVGSVSQQYSVINLVPKTQPIPAKPFVFDTAYGHIVASSEYYPQEQKKAQQEQQEEEMQEDEQLQAPQAAADDAPKSFWSRLWG